MLQTLSIHNLAVVASLQLELETGLTVLTGETGAGKSILLTALGLALGDRADANYIRPGSDKAEVILEFNTKDVPIARQWLEERGFNDEENSCLIRRLVSRDGRSKSYINDRPVTLKNLQQLASNLVEIHGQHAHLGLLNNQEQRRLLDLAADNTALVNQVNQCYQQWHQLQVELEAHRQAESEQVSRRELLSYQLSELEQAEIEALNYPRLCEEHLRHANLDKILSVGQTHLDLLYEGERQSVNQQLGHSIDALNELSQLAPELKEVTALLSDALIQVQESGQQLRRSLDTMEADPQRLIWLEEQMAKVHSLAHKHQIEPAALQQHYSDLCNELKMIRLYSENTESLQTKIAETVADYQQWASKLSKKRQAYARKLQQQVTHIIRELSMPQGQFQIEVNERDVCDTPHLNGRDQIDFLVSANPGMPPQPLAKIASGGELSRIGLAVQVVITANRGAPSMIFDEVDTGVGGGVAEIVGQRLRELGQRSQLLCVTHLPQVAAQGHHHLLVEKMSKTCSTQTSVRRLSSEERKQEIARMLGGVKITEQTIAHAEEMLAWQGE